jgi:hypothetical protein
MMDSIKEIGSPGWADFAFRFTGDGFEISERINTEMAEAGLAWKDEAKELFQKMLANVRQGFDAFGKVNQEAQTQGEKEDEDTPLPPGGVF